MCRVRDKVRGGRVCEGMGRRKGGFGEYTGLKKGIRRGEGRHGLMDV